MTRETVVNAAQRIGKLDRIQPLLWEDLRVSGKIVIDEILSAIDESATAVFEITNLKVPVSDWTQ